MTQNRPPFLERKAALATTALLALAAACARTGEEVDVETILARDRAADLGARSSRWDEARALLAPLVSRKDAPLEDLLRAANAQLADKEATDPARLAGPLVERAARLAPDDAGVLWCQYRIATLEHEEHAALVLLRRLLELRPHDSNVQLALASTLAALDESETETEAQERYRALLALPPEQLGLWRMTALYGLAHSLSQTGRVDEAKPFFDELNELLARGLVTPGVPSHETGTLGEVPPHTPRVFDRPAPVPRTTTFLDHPLGDARIRAARVVALRLEPVRDIGGERTPHNELFELETSASVVAFGSDGVALETNGGTLGLLQTGEVLDVLPIDRRAVGIKHPEEMKGKPGDRDLDLLFVTGGSERAELFLLENVAGEWTLREQPLATLPPLDGPGRLLGFDYDHDGDLDILVTAASGPVLLRNDGFDGSGGFTDATAEAGLPSGDFRAMAEDLDRDNDIDLLLIERSNGRLRYLSNLRGGHFTDRSASLPAGLAGTWIVPADFDGDNWIDLAVFGADLTLHTRTPTGGWNPEVRRFALPEPPTGEPCAVDQDLDGTFDLLWPCAKAPAAGLLAPGFASGGVPVTLGAAFATPRAGPATLELADLDGDRDLDLLRLDASGLHAFLAEGSGTGLLLGLWGHKDYARADGAWIELRAGREYRRLTYRGTPELVGLGGKKIDVVRVTWPDGVVQSNFDFAPSSAVLIGERPGLGGSCPFLYTWNGTTYEYITDVLGITPLGLPMAPGMPGAAPMMVPPDHDEYVLVKGEQLVPRDGVYEMHFTEELREVTYLDRIRLDVIDHPVGTEIFPNERFCFPPFPEAHTHTVRDPLVPLRATDQEGRDWTEALARDDRRFAIPFEALNGPYRGLATPYSLELAFDPERVKDAPQLRLFLNGWFYWTDASVNMAVGRHPDYEFVPPLLSVPDGNGGWKGCGPIGFPAGKLKTMVADLAPFLNRDDPRIRLFSTLRLYWDSIRLAVDADDAPLVTTALEPVSAKLWQRGFSRSFPLLGEHDCEWFEWDRLEAEPRWNQHPGLYTRLGETLPLVSSIDDRFVVMGAGDALTVRFDATKVPPLPEGWRRDFLVFLDGWAKDRDPNTVDALYVEPLPFHGMSAYPWPADEHAPDDEAQRAYRREWNTRPATRWIEPLVPPPLPVARPVARRVAAGF